MSRRVRLPGADELFRSTQEDSEGSPGQSVQSPRIADIATPEEPEDTGNGGSRRVKHDEKMTVYVTADELLAVEHARLSLRRELGQTVDRGRLVREALALALADYEARGLDSDLSRRLQDK